MSGNGQTPLHLAAAFNSDPEVLRVLIEAAADMNCRDKQLLASNGSCGNHAGNRKEAHEN